MPYECSGALGLIGVWCVLAVNLALKLIGRPPRPIDRIGTFTDDLDTEQRIKDLTKRLRG